MLKILICVQFLGSFCSGFMVVTPDKSVDFDQPLKTLIFLGTDCPISQDYVGLLNEMNLRYSGKVEFKGVIPEAIDARAMNDFKNEYQVKFEVVVDKNLSLTEKYEVHVTPEVVLLDQAGIVRYQGAIDNWYYELGKHRQVATEHYLKDAIEALLLGSTVEIKKTEAVGCILSTPAHHH